MHEEAGLSIRLKTFLKQVKLIIFRFGGSFAESLAEDDSDLMLDFLEVNGISVTAKSADRKIPVRRNRQSFQADLAVKS
jgi:hypothetical protein